MSGPRKLDDSRNSLHRYYVKYLEEKRPLAFVGENVKGMLTLGDGKIFEAISADMYSKGYTVLYKLNNLLDQCEKTGDPKYTATYYILVVPEIYIRAEKYITDKGIDFLIYTTKKNLVMIMHI